MLLLAFVFWNSRSYSGASHGASVVMEKRQAWLIFGRFSLKILCFGACGTKFLCICDGFEVACGLGVAMGTQIHIFGALWENQSGGKTRVDVHRVMSNWSLLCGFEVDLSLGMTWVVLCALNLEILEAVWMNPTQPLRGPPCTWLYPFGSLIVHLRWTWGRLWLQCM